MDIIFTAFIQLELSSLSRLKLLSCYN